ncbi:hypothetical protein [Faecalimicrobium sp. JNUCC 81]
MKILTNIINKTKNVKECNLPFGSKEFGSFLKETYKESIDETILLNEDLYSNLLEYDEIIDSLSKLECKKKIIEHKLQNEMKEYENAFCMDRKITWKKVTKNSIDSKKLKEDHPDIVSNYIKVSSNRVFKIK